MVWQFHSSCHGTNITLEASGTKASRNPDTYDNGVVFSETPINAEETVSLFFKRITSTRWTGVPRIGFTNQNPDQLDLKSLPQIYTEESWYKGKTWAMPLAKRGDENLFVDYEFDHNGIVCVRQLGQSDKLADPRGAVDFKKPVWVTLDLCGCYGDVFNNGNTVNILALFVFWTGQFSIKPWLTMPQLYAADTNLLCGLFSCGST